MIFLLFSIGADRYALEAGCVVEVLPRTELKQVPRTPAGVAGILDYHGAPVPVVDLSAMALDVPSKESMSTRILIVRYGQNLLGILAESATETIRLEAGDFVEPGVSSSPGAPYLGPVAHVNSYRQATHSNLDRAGSRIVQKVEVEKLLSSEVRERLWQSSQSGQ